MPRRWLFRARHRRHRALRRDTIETFESADPQVAGAIGQETGDPGHRCRRFVLRTTKRRRRPRLQTVEEIADTPDVFFRIDEDQGPLQRNLVAVNGNFGEGTAAGGIESKHGAPRPHPQCAVCRDREAGHVGLRESMVLAEMPEGASVETFETFFGAEPEEAVPVLDDNVDVGVDAAVEGGEGRERKAFGARGPRVGHRRREHEGTQSARTHVGFLLERDGPAIRDRLAGKHTAASEPIVDYYVRTTFGIQPGEPHVPDTIPPHRRCADDRLGTRDRVVPARSGKSAIHLAAHRGRQDTPPFQRRRAGRQYALSFG